MQQLRQRTRWWLVSLLAQATTSRRSSSALQIAELRARSLQHRLLWLHLLWTRLWRQAWLLSCQQSKEAVETPPLSALLRLSWHQRMRSVRLRVLSSRAAGGLKAWIATTALWAHSHSVKMMMSSLPGRSLCRHLKARLRWVRAIT